MFYNSCVGLSIRTSLRSAKLATFLVFATSIFGSGAPTYAAVVYSETVSGDAPAGSGSVNLGALAAGSSQIVGGNSVFDSDDYTFLINPGFQLDSIMIEDYTAGWVTDAKSRKSWPTDAELSPAAPKNGVCIAADPLGGAGHVSIPDHYGDRRTNDLPIQLSS